MPIVGYFVRTSRGTFKGHKTQRRKPGTAHGFHGASLDLTPMPAETV
jgi:hypothetical protein